jgi:methyl-accepting chemotaxis protein
MTHWTRKLCTAILILAGAALAPERAWAQAVPKVGNLTTMDALTAQERELLAIANELSRRCGHAMERWIANKEVTEERLFNFLYYPMPKTDPTKFTTDWDRLSDRDILAIEEAVLARSQAIVYAVITDRNGYVPTHNQRFSQPLTGNAAVDLVNNRTKRMYHDRAGIAAARNEAPFLIQRYERDTGEVLADLSVPLYVRGLRWGAVRIGYRPFEGR